MHIEAFHMQMWFTDTASPNTRNVVMHRTKKACKPAKCSIRVLLCLVEFGLLELKNL